MYRPSYLTLEEAHMPAIREMEQSGSRGLGQGQNLVVAAHEICESQGLKRGKAVPLLK